jgi:DNA polymerase I-like protein with 3'-5' exonuclease and polymerase domains
MIVYFVTRRTDHQITSPLIKIVQPEDPLLKELLDAERLIRFEHPAFRGWDIWGYDIENRRGFPTKDKLLLSSFCIANEEVITIDNTSVESGEVFSAELLRRSIFISHNADHEARFGLASGFLPARYGCTLVNGRRLLSGQEGYRFDLVSEINRHLGWEALPIWMDKDIRETFEACTFFDDDQVLYNAADTIRLKELFFVQLAKAEQANQRFLHNTINSRLILPFAEAEMSGMRHDTAKWVGIAKDREAKAKELCKEMDNILSTLGVDLRQINPESRKKLEQIEKKLQDTIDRLERQEKTHLKSYQVTKDALAKLVTTLATVDDVSIGTALNYNSPVQVTAALQAIGCPLPTIKDKGKKSASISFKKEARNMWFTNHAGSPFIAFMEKFDKYKKTIHNVNSFGENWVRQYVKEDGRVYTLLDQAGTDTGRPTGGSKGKIKEYPNLLQIPKPDEYRECFVADPGRKLVTIDYKNCEGVLMIALSGDLDMKKLTELPDQHSYLGTLCWRAVYADRYEKTGDEKWKVLAESYQMDQSTPEKKKERDIFKNSGGLFPVAYGVAAAKVAGAAKITETEGQIMIDTIKAQIPKVITFLDSKSKEAITTGYVVHNTRSGSRRGFTPVLDQLHYGWKMDKSDKAEIEFAARNSPIQGGNSDLTKEAIIMIHMWAKIFKQDIRFLLTVYDEIVLDVPADQAERLADVACKFMIRAAQNYLIPEITMGVDCRIADYWKK